MDWTDPILLSYVKYEHIIPLKFKNYFLSGANWSDIQWSDYFWDNIPLNSTCTTWNKSTSKNNNIKFIIETQII